MKNTRKINKPVDMVVKRRMLERGVTRNLLGEKFGIIPERISQLLAGYRKPLDVAEALCDELGLDFEVMFGNDMGE